MSATLVKHDDMFLAAMERVVEGRERANIVEVATRAQRRANYAAKGRSSSGTNCPNQKNVCN